MKPLNVSFLLDEHFSPQKEEKATNEIKTKHNSYPPSQHLNK